MKALKARQVHLDFHTSEHITEVGHRFNKNNFQQALKLGNVNSITVFAKCHHSWCYYPTRIGAMHPALGFDLMGAMVEAAHEIGVRAPIYITAGWSANDAEDHPEWIARNADGSLQVTNFDVTAEPSDKKPAASWKNLCLNGPYAEHIYALTEEICEQYPLVDGIFYDMCFLGETCFCDSCIEGMLREGLDPHNNQNAKKYYIEKRQQFMENCMKILHRKHKEATIFFNGGASQYKPEFHPWPTHFELEDLPTTWGGYDKMPLRAKYFKRTGKDYLGMTGKFHTSWGEFGGFKSPEALLYECAAMLTFGARCSIGDQLHPCGEMDLETYRIIGEAYRYVEKIEDYCFGSEETTKLGIILSGDTKSDEGIVKMLLEKQLDFDIASNYDELLRFDALILPDSVFLDEDHAERIKDFVAKGGSVLLTGESGLDKTKSKMLLDAGVNYIGDSTFENDYVRLGDSLNENLVKTPFLFYESGKRVQPVDGEILAWIREPYFNRTYGHYCSHLNTPYLLEDSAYPAAVKKGNVVYLAHKVCKMYFEHGAKFHRDYLINALKLIYQEPVMNVSMQSSGRARFVKQTSHNRYVLHLLYGTPIQRGRTSVIEDMPAIFDIEVMVKIKEKVTGVYQVPKMENINFMQDGDSVTFTVPKLVTHQCIVIEYGI